LSKIPDCTQEIKQRLENNTSSLIELGVKEWMKKRRKKANMSELEQKEMLRKIEDKLETKDGG
jgi:hypothetical protein